MAGLKLPQGKKLNKELLGQKPLAAADAVARNGCSDLNLLKLSSDWSDEVDIELDSKTIACAKSANFGIKLSKSVGQDSSEQGAYTCLPQEFLRTQCEFTAHTQHALRRYSRRYQPEQNSDGSTTYTIPIHGISNRSIQGDLSVEPKFFQSLMSIRVPKDAHNFDQCTIVRAPRKEVSATEYRNSIQEEISGSQDLLPETGPIGFFTHGVFACAGQSDDDVMRIFLESGIPTINIDWRSTPGKSYTRLIRYGIDFHGAITQEKAFEPYLDETVKWLNPSRCAFIAFSRGSAFNAAYMKHRHESFGESTQKLNTDLFAHPDLETEKFKVRDDCGNNPITASADNTIVLGSPRDKALLFASHWFKADRVGDAGKQDIEAVTRAGGRYLIDESPKRGNNFNHFINYRSLGGLVNDLLQH